MTSLRHSVRGHVRLSRLFTLFFAGVLAVLSLATPARAQLSWTAYDTTGARVGEADQAATFDAATGTYTLTIPAGVQHTFIARNIVPIALTTPASGASMQTVKFTMTASGGFTSGTAVGDRNFLMGLFDTNGTEPGATGNFTDDKGVWTNARPNTSGNFSSEGFASAGTTTPAGLLGYVGTGTQLGSSRGPSGAVGSLTDGQAANVTFRVRINDTGAIGLGTGTAVDVAGAVYQDAATGGTTLNRTFASNNSSASLTGSQTFNLFAVALRNSTDNPVTLVLSHFEGLIAPPYIVTHPPSVLTASLAGNITITAAAGGNPASYQWEKSTDGGTTYAAIDAGANPSAATASLTLSNVQNDAAGLYRVVVTNAAGSSTSSAATLTVTAGAVAPTILSEPADVTVLVGQNASFTVSANGTAPLAYQWKKGGTDIVGANDSTLNVTSAQLADAGSYTVVVSNSAGSANSAAATLTVNEAPVITAQPAGATLAAGGSHSLTVVATGAPAPAYQWKKNGVDIPSATSASYTIASATGADAGVYTVVVTNVAGSVTSAAAPVIVGSSTLAATAFTPASAATALNADTRLTLTFNEAISPGFAGRIRIHDASDDSVVDTINLVEANARRDTLRASSAISTLNLPVEVKTIGGLATINYYPITVSGATATIHPRDGVLAYGKSYYVTIEPGAFVNAAGESFAGIQEKTTWTFSTRATAPDLDDHIVVAADGSGDFDTVQGALDFVPAANTTPRTIFIRNGTYFEQIVFQQKHNLTIVGESAEGVIIDFPTNNNFNNASGTYRRGTLLAQSVSGLRLLNFTVRNSTPQGGSQAEAIIIKGSATTGQNLASKLRLFSYQDTLQVDGQFYMSDSYIEGDVDFLWGNGPSFFYNCEFKALRRTSNVPIFAQIRNGAGNHGFVFHNCRFTAEAGVTGAFFHRIDPGAAQFPYSEMVILDSTVGSAENNSFLNTAIGGAAANYQAGWWQLNNATDAPNVHLWDNNMVDKDGVALTFGEGVRPAFTIMPVDATTQANYRNPVWVLNTARDGSATAANWTPALAPVILTPPASAALNAGDALSLSVSVAALPAATYQWKKDGADIPGATAATYSVASATAGDTGSYTVAVTNSAGSATSTAALITVGSGVIAPSISAHPADVSVASGQLATFTVVAAGSAPLTYQWKKNGTDIPGATSATYTIASAAVSDNGAYTVVVSNSASSITSSAGTLTVSAPPPSSGAITLLDDSFADGSALNQDLANGSVRIYKARTATTRTDAVGSVTFTPANSDSDAHWFHFTDAPEAVALKVGESFTVSVTFKLATPKSGAVRFGLFNSEGTRLLVDKGSGHNDSLLQGDRGYGGEMAIDASASAGPFVRLGRRDTVTSGNLFNSNNDFPVLPSPVVGSTSRLGFADDTPYTLTMTVRRDSETANEISFALTGGAFPENYTYSAIDTGAPTTTFAFDWFGFRYGGSNLASAVTFTNVKVVHTKVASSTPAPVITAQPTFAGGETSLTTLTGAAVSLSVTATGDALSYQWKKDGVDIPGATSATYAIASALVSHSGSYTVAVSNAGGDVLSSAATLTVNAPVIAPIITTHPADVTVALGESATLTVAASGTEPFTYQWKKDGADIADATSASFTIVNATAAASGSYTVVVTNVGGSATSNAAVVTVNTAVIPTSIVTQPAAQSVVEGQPVTFAVAAQGTFLTYQWQKGGADIVGATSATLVIGGAQLADAGDYTVVVSGADGTVTSAVATLTVTTRTVKTIFSDNFSAGSTVNSTTPATPTENSAAYQILADKNYSPVPSISATGLKMGMSSTSSGNMEAQALFGSAPVILSGIGDYIEITATVTNVAGMFSTTPPANNLTANNQNTLYLGLYDSDQVSPVPGGLTTLNSAATHGVGYVKEWVGYVGSVVNHGMSGATNNNQIRTRPVQSNALNNYNQSLASAAFRNPAGAVVGAIASEIDAPTSAGGQYTAVFRITRSATAEYTVEKRLYDGAGTAGTLLATVSGIATGDTFLTDDSDNLGFDGFALGARVTNTPGQMEINAVTITTNASLVPVPKITTQPQSQTVGVGSAVTFTVAAEGSGLAYQWYKNDVAIDGANGPSYTIASAVAASQGIYKAVVANDLGGRSTSARAELIVDIAAGAPPPDGFAHAVTGGGNRAAVVVTNAADFKTHAESADPAVITITGTLDLAAVGGAIQVKSNKTIQGFDQHATIRGKLDLGSGGVNNVLIRGLNITNPGSVIVDGKYTDGGDGITVAGATNVFITHCTVYDCADGLIDIGFGSDNVTVSWCEFYYTSAAQVHRFTMITGNAGAETKPLHITLHHNLWHDLCDQRMPSGSFGYVHLYNNYWNTPGNSYASNARDQSQFFSEHNVYHQVKSPLYKENVDPALPGGLIRAIGNVYTEVTGEAADAGQDTVFTPTYSYQLLSAVDVPTIVLTGAGNTAGAASASLAAGSATLNGPAGVVPVNTSFTLTAAVTGFTPVSYQWRRNNFDIAGATAATFSVASMKPTDEGVYSLAMKNEAGDTLVSNGHKVVYSSALVPTITSQPANVSVSAGQPASFSVTATGDAPLTYQWQKNLGGNFTNITGANATSLGFLNAQAVHAGQYRVVVTNDVGTAISNTVTLTVTETPADAGSGSSDSGGGGGGGSPSLWFLGALALLAALRRRRD